MAGTPDQIAARWAQNLGGATQKITEGVQAVPVAPGQAAARQKSVWMQNTTAAADKWARNTAAVSLSEWQQLMIGKGVQRIGSGAQGAIPKMQAFMTALLPQIATVRGSLPARGNLDANVARMTAFVRGMAAWSYKR